MPMESIVGPSATVVLIEDHPTVREHLVELLRAAGLDVVEAAFDVASGYEAVVRLRPDIAVVDNRLPDGRGVVLCEILAREVPETALIVHSGAVTAEETEQAMAAGVHAVVPKSLRSSRLLEALAAATPAR